MPSMIAMSSAASNFAKLFYQNIWHEALKPKKPKGPKNYGSSRRGQVFWYLDSRMLPPFLAFLQAEAIEREEDQEWITLQLSNLWSGQLVFEKLLTWGMWLELQVPPDDEHEHIDVPRVSGPK